MDEYKYENIKVLHRLDKPTSGIVILGKSKEMAEYFRQRLHSDSVKKTYLCRVKGNVSWEFKKVVRAILLIDKAKGIYSDCEGNVNDNDNDVRFVKKGESLKKGEHYADDVDLSLIEEKRIKEEYENEKKGSKDNKQSRKDRKKGEIYLLY